MGAFAAVAAVAVAVAAVPAAAQQGSQSYPDVASEAYYAQAVEALESSGVFEGTECAEGFCPHQALPRWQMAVWLVRALEQAEPQATVSRFADVESDLWWMPYAERLAELEITVGCRSEPLSYCPSRPVSRAQMASFLARAFDLPAAEPAGFADVDSQTNVHGQNIDRLAASKITVGCRTEPLSYCPSRSVTRAQMAAFIYRGLKWKEAQAPELSLGEQLAALVLDGTNASRDPSWVALALDAGLSAVAQTKAQAMADTQTWQYNFDFVSRLEPDWDIWRRGLSVSTDVDANDPRMAAEMGAALVDEDGAALLVCPLCTGLGTGLASANGRVYATVIVAGRIPGESISEHEMVDVEAEMADLVNDLRESLGLRPLEYHAGVAASARRWSRTMGAEQDFRHNLALGDHYPPGFFMAGENIAAVKYRDSLSEAVLLAFGDLTNSPLHHANMTEPGFTHQGIGVVLKAGWVWITQNFAAYP